MGTYDKYSKRLELISAKVKANRDSIQLEFDPAKLSNPVENIEYIFDMLSSNKITIQLTKTERDLSDLVDLGLEIRHETS